MGRTSPEDPDRLNSGVVFKEGGTESGPATHVLIIGVGDYRNKAMFPDELDSATRSARALADWFLADAPPCFKNANCPLGSIGILLSEAPSGSASTYASGLVPRATFANVQAATLSWLSRVQANPDNLAVLYVASHGVSFEKRSAFLLEEYGTNPMIATLGMVEIEQFTQSLENSDPLNQLLLFDCCRSNLVTPLAPNERLGAAVLIALAARTGGVQLNQWTIAAAALNAYGVPKGSTLFNSALIEALNGVASDTAVANWPVRPEQILSRVQSILKLNNYGPAARQIPASQNVGTFDICYPGVPDDHPVYISLADNKQWSGSTISIEVSGQPNLPIVAGGPAHRPFEVRRFAGSSRLQLTATRADGSLIGTETRVVYPPVQFVQIGGVPAVHVARNAAPAHRAGTGGGLLDVAVQGTLARFAVATVKSITLEDTGVPGRALDVNASQELGPLPSGQYAIELRSPDGRVQTQQIDVEENELTTATFELNAATDDWALWPQIAGDLIAEPPEGGGFKLDDLNVEDVVHATIDLRLESAGYGIRCQRGHLNEHLLRFDVKQEMARRFPDHRGKAAFAKVRGTQKRTELAVLPSVGRPAVRLWTPYLIADGWADVTQRMTSVGVDNLKWVGLFGFLGQRDFASGQWLLEGSEGGLIHSAKIAWKGRDDAPNPFPNLAVAMVALGSGKLSPELHGRVEEIAKALPQLPDAAIILARHRLVTAGDQADLDQALKLFNVGYGLGIPHFTLCVDWLAHGLNSLSSDCKEHAGRQLAARGLASRVDPTTAFTVVRLT